MKIQDLVNILKKYPQKNTVKIFEKESKKFVYVDGILCDNGLVQIIFDYDEGFHSLSYATMVHYFEQFILKVEKEPIIRFRQFGSTKDYEILENETF